MWKLEPMTNIIVSTEAKELAKQMGYSARQSLSGQSDGAQSDLMSMKLLLGLR
jgi:hypothetical protein